MVLFFVASIRLFAEIDPSTILHNRAVIGRLVEEYRDEIIGLGSDSGDGTGRAEQFLHIDSRSVMDCGQRCMLRKVGIPFGVLRCDRIDHGYDHRGAARLSTRCGLRAKTTRAKVEYIRDQMVAPVRGNVARKLPMQILAVALEECQKHITSNR
jgi:hypothetical protein